jgi:hypothetical protein
MSGRLEQIINMKQELVQLAGEIDWVWLDSPIARSRRSSDKGRPGIQAAPREAFRGMPSGSNSV